MEFYNSDIELKVIFDTQNNTVTLRCTETNEEEISELEANDTEDLVSFMQVPGFGWGMALIKISRAIVKKISGGSSAT